MFEHAQQFDSTGPTAKSLHVFCLRIFIVRERIVKDRGVRGAETTSRRHAIEEVKRGETQPVDEAVFRS